MQLPGWDSVETASRIHSFSEIAGIVCLALLVVFEVLSLGYGHRRETLAHDQEQRAREQEQQAHEKELRALQAALPAPIVIGTLTLEVRDRYTGKVLSDAICTTTDGKTIPAGRKIELPVGPFSGVCTLAGYIPEPVDGEAHDGKTTTRPVEMEQKTGALQVIVKDTDGRDMSGDTLVSINGGEPRRILGGNLPDLKAGSVAHLLALGTQSTTEDGKGSVIKKQKWGSASAEQKVRGGVSTNVTLTVPVLDPETGKPK